MPAPPPRLPLPCTRADGAQPRLVLADVSGSGCTADPMAQCLSDFLLTTSSTCAVTLDTGTYLPAAATVRLQKLWLSGGDKIVRNAMSASFPWIGDDAYVTCLAKLQALPAAMGGTDAGAPSGAQQGGGGRAGAACFVRLNPRVCAGLLYAAVGVASALPLLPPIASCRSQTADGGVD